MPGMRLISSIVPIYSGGGLGSVIGLWWQELYVLKMKVYTEVLAFNGFTLFSHSMFSC